MSVGFSIDTEFILSWCKVKREHIFYGDAVKITFDDGACLICGEDQLLWFDGWVRAIDCYGMRGAKSIVRIGRTRLKDITLSGFKHVFKVRVGDRLLLAHNMPSAGGGSNTYKGTRRVKLYLYRPYDNPIYSTRKTYKNFLNPYTDKSVLVQLGGTFEEIGGNDEAVGGGDQKVGSSNQ